MRAGLAVLAFIWLTFASVAIAAEDDRARINAETAADFAAGRYGSLEAAAEDYRRTRAFNVNGGRKLASFYQGLMNATVATDDASSDAINAKLRDWIVAYPRSGPAHVMTAKVAIDRAWRARGGAPIDKTSLIQREAFARGLHLAWLKLEAAKEFASDDPHWHAMALRLARGVGLSREDYDALAAKALDVDPRYGFISDEILLNKEPRWGGSWEAYDAAVEDIVARTSAELGLGSYALSYASLSRFDNGRSFERSLVKWPRLKQAFEDLIARFPSDQHINLFGALACIKSDKETLRAVLARLGANLRPEYWSHLVNPASCVYVANRDRLEAEDAAHYAKPRALPDELVERNAIRKESANAFVAGRFAELDALYASYLDPQARTKSGARKLEFFYDGIGNNSLLYPSGATVDTPDIKAVEDQLSRWLTASPGSTPAAIELARFSLFRAKLLRQPTYKAENPDTRGTDAFKSLASARQQLEALRDRTESDPEWWASKLGIEREDHTEDAELDALAGEALRRHPGYERVYSEILQRMNRDEAKSFEPLVQNVLASSGENPAFDEIYARSYLWLVSVNRGGNPVEAAGAKWSIAKTGLEAIVERWPSDWNFNAYANLACLAKDREAARQALSRIDGRIVEFVWANRRAPKTCADWANGG